MQTGELHRPVVTEAQLRASAFFQVHTSTGDVPNPLWPFDGSIDLLTR